MLSKFRLAEADPLLLDLAIAQPNDTAGVKAATLLLKSEDNPLLAQTLQARMRKRAAALATALGNVGGSAVVARLTPLVTDSERRWHSSAAAAALGKSKAGEDYLLSLVEAKKLPADLNFTVANVLLGSSRAEVRSAAGKHLSLPAAAGAQPLPPLKELVKIRGDATHGKQLFEGIATCNKCHAVNGQGKDVGPNLSEIGAKLSKEALLVSILDPSAGISHNFESYAAATADGKVITGVLVSKTDNEITLKDANAIVHSLKASEVEEFKKLETSLMPADLQKLLTPQDLADVVEYLMTLKKAEPAR